MEDCFPPCLPCSLFALGVSLSEGEGKFESPGVDVGKSGILESTLTTVSPYPRFKLTERVSAWGLAGFGVGDMTIGFDDGGMVPVRTDTSMRLGAVGARGGAHGAGRHGRHGLGAQGRRVLRADGVGGRRRTRWRPRPTRAGCAWCSRGGRAFALSETATLRPSFELGVRHDGGDAETGAGLEVGGGVTWADTASGLSLEAKARTLAAHADSDYEEWGASATARLEPEKQRRGLSFSLTPTLGTPSSTAERLWGARRPSELAPGGPFEATRGFQAEAGYGLPLFGGRFTGTPNLGLGLANGEARDWRVGWRLTSAGPGGSAFEVNLDGDAERGRERRGVPSTG